MPQTGRTRFIDPQVHRISSFHSTNDFCSSDEVPPGILTIYEGGVPIDINNNFRGYKRTVVFFHAAITKSVSQLPMFLGSGFSGDVEANRIFISDPSLYLDDSLRLSWYAGSHIQPNLQKNLRQILEHIFLQQGVDDVIFFGASGGGFAALYYSYFFPHSLALPVNPQTDISMYKRHFVHAYADKAWQVDPNEYDPLRLITATTEVLSLYATEAKNTVLYVQNAGDVSHVNRHYIPFMEAAKSRTGVFSLVENWGDGHVPPSREYLKAMLELACTSNEWNSFAEKFGAENVGISRSS